MPRSDSLGSEGDNSSDGKLSKDSSDIPTPAAGAGPELIEATVKKGE